MSLYLAAFLIGLAIGVAGYLVIAVTARHRHRPEPIRGHVLSLRDDDGEIHVPRLGNAKYVLSYESDDRKVRIEHLNGVDWIDAPIPPRRHKCWVQTRGHTDWFKPVNRCACGALNYPDMDRGHSPYWMERNSRKPRATEVPPLT